MIDQLINLGKQQLGQTLKQNQNLNDQQVDQTFNIAQSSFLDGLKNQAMSGNISQLTNLFNGKESNSSFLSSSIMSSMVPQLTSKLGVPQDKANSIANSVVPFLVNKFASKETGTVNNSGDLMSMFNLGDIGGDMLGGLTDKLGGFFK
jgi:hypothetical protein